MCDVRKKVFWRFVTSWRQLSTDDVETSLLNYDFVMNGLTKYQSDRSKIETCRPHTDRQTNQHTGPTNILGEIENFAK